VTSAGLQQLNAALRRTVGKTAWWSALVCLMVGTDAAEQEVVESLVAPFAVLCDP